MIPRIFGRFKLLVWVALLVLAAGCGTKDPLASAAAPIGGGSLDRYDLFPFVVEYNNLRTDTFCSGSAVSLRDVLIAAHCICEATNGLAKNAGCAQDGDIIFRAQAEGLAPTAHVVSVDVCPTFRQVSDSSGLRSSECDLAVLHLDADAPPWALSSQLGGYPPSANEKVFLVGFGNSICQKAPIDPATATRIWGTNTIDSFGNDGSPFPDRLVVSDDGADQAIGFPGDSGSPLLDARDGKTIIGVDSFVTCPASGAVSSYTRTDLYFGWINDHLSRPCQLEEICGNGKDDDCNGLADCADPACVGDPSCPNCGIEGSPCCSAQNCGDAGLVCDPTHTCVNPNSQCSNGICETHLGETCGSCPADCCLPAPSLLSPAGGAVYQTGSSVTFSWSPVAGAKRYKLAVCPDQTLTNCSIIQEPDVGVTTWMTTADATMNGFWSVFAIPWAEPAGWGYPTLPPRAIATMDQPSTGWSLRYQPSADVLSVASISGWSSNFSSMTFGCSNAAGTWTCALPGDPGSSFQMWASVTLPGGESASSCFASSACAYTLRGSVTLVNPSGQVTPLTGGWNQQGASHCNVCNAMLGTPVSCDPQTPNCDPSQTGPSSTWKLVYVPDQTVASVSAIWGWSSNFVSTAFACTPQGNQWVCDLPGDPGARMQAWADVALTGGQTGSSCTAATPCAYAIRGSFSVVDPSNHSTPLTPAWNNVGPDHCVSCNASLGEPFACDTQRTHCDPNL